jgi:hypothetical protein
MSTTPPEIVAVVSVLIVDVAGGADVINTILDTCGAAVLVIVFPDIRIPKPGILY